MKATRDTKQRILELLEGGGIYTSQGVAVACRMKPKLASSMLGHLHDEGVIERVSKATLVGARGGPRMYAYRLRRS